MWSVTNFLEYQRTRIKSSPGDAEKLAAVGEAPPATDLDTTEVAAWTAVCRAVFNLHETLTRD